MFSHFWEPFFNVSRALGMLSGLLFNIMLCIPLALLGLYDAKKKPLEMMGGKRSKRAILLCLFSVFLAFVFFAIRHGEEIHRIKSGS